jgi:hypothetical protein
MDDHIYVLCNEGNTLNTYKFLDHTTSNLELGKQSCHIGVSCWFNLDIIAIRHSQTAILFDINPNVTLFLETTFKCIMDHPTRQEFVASFLLHNQKTMISDAAIYNELSRPYSWLSSDNSYQYIRSLTIYDDNKIKLYTLDIFDTSAVKKMTEESLYHDTIMIDTLYVSNIKDCIGFYSRINKTKMSRAQQYQNYSISIQCLLEEKTILISAQQENHPSKKNELRLMQTCKMTS